MLFGVFEEMMECVDDVKLDGVTFVGLLVSRTRPVFFCIDG